MITQERPSWAARLEANCEAADVHPMAVARAWVDATQRGYTLLDADMQRFIGLGDCPDGPEDDGLPVFLMDESLAIVGIEGSADDYRLEDERIWEWQELVSSGHIEVIRIDDDHVAYFGHPMAEFPGLD